MRLARSPEKRDRNSAAEHDWHRCPQPVPRPRQSLSQSPSQDPRVGPGGNRHDIDGPIDTQAQETRDHRRQEVEAVVITQRQRTERQVMRWIVSILDL